MWKKLVLQSIFLPLPLQRKPQKEKTNFVGNVRDVYRPLPTAIVKKKPKPIQSTVHPSTNPTAYSTIHPISVPVPTVYPTNLIMSIGLVGFFAVLFNGFSIGRDVLHAIKAVVHKSKYYFLSLAFADLYFGLFCSSYTLIRFEVIDIKDTFENRRIEKIWRETSVIVSLNASLYHVLMITLDRYLATAFPLFHKVHVTRCKISIVIILSWLLAISLAVLPLCTNSYLISEWFYIIIGCCGLFLLVVTYTHIIVVIFKRWCKLKKQCKKKSNVSMSEKSITTTIFSIIITLIYIICMAITFLHQTNVLEQIFIKFLLYSINAAVNPIFYSIIDYIRDLVLKNRKKKPLEN